MKTLAAKVLGATALLVLAVPAGAAHAYNGAAASQYADTYWSKYNSAYPSFANSGGDCTNFISQALFGGGIAMRTTPTYTGNAAWFMLRTRKSWSYGIPWINAQDNSIFLRNDASIQATPVQSVYGLGAGFTAPTNAGQGDIVAYDWTDDGTYDHDAIITAKGTDGLWDLVDAHTNSRYHAYWTLAQYNYYWQTTKIDVYHIPATAH